MDRSSSIHVPERGSAEARVRGGAGGARDSEAVVRAVRAFQAGIEREESFRLLFETYRPAVQGFFLRRLGSVDAAHDLTQETFIRVCKGLKGYRGDAPFGAWLFRIARNVLRSRRGGSATARIRAREVRIEDVEMELVKAQASGGGDGGDAEPRALTSAMREEQRQILRNAVEKLPPQRRRCVVLWAYYELTYEQIAVVMRLSIGTIKAHLAQARRQLAHLVAEATQEMQR